MVWSKMATETLQYTKVNSLLHAIQLRSKLSYTGLSSRSVLFSVAIMMQHHDALVQDGDGNPPVY